jgi:hypothetical protein
MSNNIRPKGISWPNNKDSRANPENLHHGPNINFKVPKKRYSSNEERKYFYNKIRSKQKTEVS